MKGIAFDVLGKPEPEPRPQGRIIGTGKNAYIHIYVPDTAHEWKRAIRRAYALEALPGDFAGPTIAVAAGFVFRFARPQDHYRTGRFAGQLKPWAVDLEHLTTPDLDNLIKAAKDSLGAWDKLPPLAYANDSQVCRYVGEPEKRYVRPGELPGLAMSIDHLLV